MEGLGFSLGAAHTWNGTPLVRVQKRAKPKWAVKKKGHICPRVGSFSASDHHWGNTLIPIGSFGTSNGSILFESFIVNSVLEYAQRVCSRDPSLCSV